MNRNALSKDIDKLYQGIEKIRQKHSIAPTKPNQMPTYLDKAMKELRAAYIDAIIDEEIEKTNRGLRK